MSRILVTGGAGFIGSHVVDALIAQGERVVVVDDLSSGKEENLNPKAQFYRMDICDPKLEKIFASGGIVIRDESTTSPKDRIEWVCHHAAQIDVRKSVADPREDARVNITGLLNLLENCVRYRTKGVIFVSSGGVVYGEPDQLPVNETYPKGPFSPYGVSKLCSEYYLYYYQSIHGLPYIALRYGNVYGPRQDPHGEAGVVAIFVGKMLAGETPTIFGDGKQLRDYVFVEDVAQANLLAIKQLETASLAHSLNDRAYNIGTGIGTSVNELFAHLQEIIGFRGSASYGPERKGELRRIFLDVSKAETELAWKPVVDLREGLKRTVEFFRERLRKEKRS
ncbi:NAD-dependent epimerase/dehydratase family protein [Candidatus Acetothermia bacterium]|nr:NAD-dependent epimerase/dehydratase family protein [Candidatus Acetothermia bacterium]MCI2427341.1 NAD-dependent epimerase/dehydratase family protein [Candidatus Acetothermia bacterium]MCI2428153.1 NAD-dependent epimerase/dehydratase family protein [Candidatus Acetothermia bacterium]